MQQKQDPETILRDSNPTFIFRGGHGEQWAAQKAENANINPPPRHRTAQA